MGLVETGRFLCKILRHNPEIIGITIDEHGWANVDELIKGVSKTHKLDRKLLEQIVAEDDKGRYSFSEDGKKIRCNQGHSINVDVELDEVTPPEFLYHGTATKYIDSIEAQGLIPKSRLYVHISPDIETAKKVGARHGDVVVYKIASGEMASNGFKFYKSVNGVWLTKSVPYCYMDVEYLS